MLPNSVDDLDTCAARHLLRHPPNFRVAWVASVSFGWLIVLSFKAPMVTKEPGKDELPDAKGA